MKIPPLAVVLALLCQSAQAVILFGAGNDANLTDPGGGLPFDSVARVASVFGSDGTGGSGVHLGGGYMLTAAHIANGELNSVSFNGIDSYSRDLSFTPQQIGTTDMKIFRLLSSDPEAGSANLYTGSSELSNGGSLVGWGRGRVGSDLDENIVPIAGGATPLVKRWGTNDPNRIISTFSYSTYAFDALETTLGSVGGTGDFEAAATPRDSGSGFFQNIGGTWYLTGLTSVILQQNPGNATFGTDLPWTGTTPAGYAGIPGTGDPNVFVRVSSYSTDIYALIPEPSALLLSFASLLLFLRRKR